MTETERSLVYWAIRLAIAYHDGYVGNDLEEITQIVGWADQLEKDRGVNLAYLDKHYETNESEPPHVEPA